MRGLFLSLILILSTVSFAAGETVNLPNGMQLKVLPKSAFIGTQCRILTLENAQVRARDVFVGQLDIDEDGHITETLYVNLNEGVNLTDDELMRIEARKNKHYVSNGTYDAILNNRVIGKIDNSLLKGESLQNSQTVVRSLFIGSRIVSDVNITAPNPNIVGTNYNPRIQFSLNNFIEFTFGTDSYGASPSKRQTEISPLVIENIGEENIRDYLRLNVMQSSFRVNALGSVYAGKKYEHSINSEGVISSYRVTMPQYLIEQSPGKTHSSSVIFTVDSSEMKPEFSDRLKQEIESVTKDRLFVVSCHLAEAGKTIQVKYK